MEELGRAAVTIQANVPKIIDDQVALQMQSGLKGFQSQPGDAWFDRMAGGGRQAHADSGTGKKRRRRRRTELGSSRKRLAVRCGSLLKARTVRRPPDDDGGCRRPREPPALAFTPTRSATDNRRDAMRLIQRVVDFLVLLGGYLAGAAVLAMTLLVTVDVLFRFLFGGSTRMAVEFSGYLLVVIVFWAGLHAPGKGPYRVDFFLNLLPPRVQKLVGFLGTVLFLFLSAFLGYRAWQSVLVSYQFGSTSRTGIDVTIWPYQAVIPVGLFLLSALLTMQIIQSLRSSGSDRSE